MAGYWRNLARAFSGRKNSLTPETIRALMQGQEYGDRVGVTYGALAKGGYERNVCIYRALTEIARGGASVPLDVYVNGEKQKDHPLAKLLRKPNLRQSRPVFMEEALSYFQLDGNQFFYAIDAYPGGAQGVCDFVGVFDMPIGDGNDRNLCRRKPNRESPRVVLDERSHKAF